jgi:carbamoyltransferase
MQDNHRTLAIYGIQDTMNHSYPEYVHDHNLTLYENGRIVKHLALERVTGRKYDSSLPDRLYTLLKQEKLLGMDDLSLVFVDNPVGRAFINREGNIRFEAPMNEGLSNQPERGRAWFLDRFRDAWVVNHELAHVFSALPFFGEFRENSLHVHFDGGASKSNFSAWHFLNGRLELLESHWDMKYLSSLYNANALVFYMIGAGKKDQNGLPGKFMGYSAYGSYHRKIEDWLVRHDFFRDIWGNRQIFFSRLQEDWNTGLKDFDLRHDFLQDLAATIQHIFQRDLLEKMKQLREISRAEYLYYTGGSALNIKANTLLVESGLFREVFIPPCTNDSGLSIGAGACLEWHRHGKVEQHGPYLNNWGLDGVWVEYNQEDLRKAASCIVEGKAVALYNGPGEAGPRALGNRSIIARADKPSLARQISMEMKRREWYRPVAPVMLERNLWYFSSANSSSLLARYMLRDFDIPGASGREMAGALHVDQTARIQVLSSRQENPYLYDLLEMLEEEHHLKALINTSFNAPGKPIVHTLDDACEQAREMGIHHLVVHGKMRNP